MQRTAVAIRRFRFDKSFLWFVKLSQKPFDSDFPRWHHLRQSHRRKQFRLVAFLLSALPLLAFHHHTSEVGAFDFGDSAKAFASGVPAESPESDLYGSILADTAVGNAAECAGVGAVAGSLGLPCACGVAPGLRSNSGGVRGACARLVGTERVVRPGLDAWNFWRVGGGATLTPTGAASGVTVSGADSVRCYRRTETACLLSALAADAAMLVVAEAGMGKSHLARRVAADLRAASLRIALVTPAHRNKRSWTSPCNTASPSPMTKAGH